MNTEKVNFGFPIVQRPETEDDLPFLRRLYVAIRWDEVSAMGLTDVGQKLAFLSQQFDLQRHHYRTHYHDAAFQIVESGGAPIGRLYLWRGPRDHRIVDISLQPEMTGQGIGGAILERIQAEAAAAGRGVSIHVETFNPARRLYERKGFIEVSGGESGPYHLMEWFADQPVAA